MKSKELYVWQGFMAGIINIYSTFGFVDYNVSLLVIFFLSLQKKIYNRFLISNINIYAYVYMKKTSNVFKGFIYLTCVIKYV